MKKIISFLLKRQKIKSFKVAWEIYCLFQSKYKKELWIDDEGNTLAHHAAMSQNIKIWDVIKEKPLELNHVNNFGKCPVHCFIESSFFKKSNKLKKSKVIETLMELIARVFAKFNIRIKFVDDWIDQYNEEEKNEAISISFNKELLSEMIKRGANINQFLEFPDRKELGWESTEYGSFSRKDNMGSPLELLVYYFWEFILYEAKKNNNESVVKEYEECFETLTSFGANLNVIVSGNGRAFSEVMDAVPRRLASVFFAKFITNEIDYIAIRPFLIDKNIDFLAADDYGNTILHTLFARMSSKKHKLSDEFAIKIIHDVINNKNLTQQALELKNKFDMNPLELLRDEAIHLRKYLESFMLSEKLTKELDHKNETKKVKKI